MTPWPIRLVGNSTVQTNEMKIIYIEQTLKCTKKKGKLNFQK